MSKGYKLKLPCMKCGMVGRHLNTPHWKCPHLKKKKKMIEIIALLLFISLGSLMRYMDYKFPDKDK